MLPLRGRFTGLRYDATHLGNTQGRTDFSTGALERLHRTHRTEGPFGADPGSYEAAVAQMQQYVYF